MQKTKKEPVRGKRAASPGVGTQAWLQVHLWAGDGRPDATVPAGALAMIEDFLRVSPCEPVELGQSTVRGVFSDLVQAVNAGRRLQRLVQGYSKAANDGLGAGLLLTDAADAIGDEEMNQLRQKQALSRAQPGQMFVVGALCDKVRSIPGLQFSEVESAFSEEPGGRSRRVLYVLPMAAESKGRAEDELTTRLVENFVEPPAVDTQQAASLVIKPVSRPRADAPAQEAPKRRAVEEIRSAEASATPGAKPAVRRMTAAAAVLAVAVAIAIGLHGRGSAKRDVPAAASAAAGPSPASAPPVSAGGANKAPGKPPDAAKARTTKTESAAPPNPNTAAVIQPASAPSASSPDAPKKVDPEPKPEIAKREPEKAPAPEPKSPRSTSGGGSVTYSAEEIGMLLARADKDSGDGEYDRAIAVYRSILSHDPGNQRAKQGMERAIRNKNGG